MNTVWILVCDAGRGRLFETTGSDPSWKLLEVLSHEESRTKASVQAGAAETDVEKGHFVHALVKLLDQAMRSKRFAHWVLVAPPHFLGMLKKAITPELEKHLLMSLDKDLTHDDAPALIERLRDTVRIAAGDKDLAREGAKHAH